VVSRIEMQEYTQASSHLLAIQIDAAINPVCIFSISDLIISKFDYLRFGLGLSLSLSLATHNIGKFGWSCR
jgi:hypothetical protein